MTNNVAHAAKETKAKINKATAFDGSSSSKEVLNSLNKLLKDEKNKEYQDQIYFAMGNVHYTDGEEDDAIECYEKSIETSRLVKFTTATANTSTRNHTTTVV